MSILKSQLVEKNQEIEAKSKSLEELFAKAKNDKGEYDATKAGMTAVEFAEKIRCANDELTALGKQRDSIAAGVQAEADQKRRSEEKAGKPAFDAQPDASTPGEPEKKEFKGAGRLFMESAAYKGRLPGQAGPLSTMDIELKTIMDRGTTGGFAPESLRTGRIVDAATRPIQVLDIIPMVTTSYAVVKYMEETTFTNNAVEKAEGAAFGEAALNYTEQTVTVQKLPVWIPVTDEQLEDVPFIEGRVDQRLRFMLMQRLDGQCMVGDGVSPNMLGITNKGSVQTQAKAGDPTPDAIRKAMTKVRITGRAMPSAVVLHPNDWDDIRLLRTADGIYIWGNPSENGPERIWSVPVAQSDALTEGTGVTGDFANFAYLASRRGIDVQIGYQNDDFVKGRRAIRADLRACFVWERAAAFCLITGI